jgi:hypothetical protein
MMTTLENASSRRAASWASAVGPDTVAYGDHRRLSNLRSPYEAPRQERPQAAGDAAFL